MQIHELNDYTGSLNTGAYLAVDNGSDTGRVSVPTLLDQTNQAIAAVDARVDNIIAGKAPSAAEVTDARLGADGVTYDSLGDAIREQITGVYFMSDWENTISKVIASNGQARFYIYAHKDDIITVEGATGDNGNRFKVYYSDGTNNGYSCPIGASGNNIAVRFRAEKDITYIGVYCLVGTTLTVTKSEEPLYITNYYDKDTKISGFIDSGNIYSGYYHSDFIPFAMGETIRFSGYPGTFGTVRAFFYNDEYTYRGRVTAVLQDDGLYEIETDLTKVGSAFNSLGDIHYVAFNMSVAGSDTAVMYRNNIPYDSVLYGQHLPEDEELLFNAIQKAYIANSGGQPIAGKKIAYNGDSIAESRITGTAENGGAYPKMIADITGGTYDNRAKGGGVLASAIPNGTAARYVSTDVANMPDDADLICFEGGVNDYWDNVPLGDYVDNDYTGTVDTTTICGALESIFRQATAKWVGKPIVFVIVHKVSNIVYVANSAGYTFAQAREKMIGICQKYAIPFYDAFAESGLNGYNSIQNTNFLTANASGTPDGCHPNAAGYEKYYVSQLIALFNSVMPRS